MSKEIEKEEGGGAIGALLVGIVLLPADLALSRLYGSFTGLYYFGRVGGYLVETSTVILLQQAVLMERAGNNLKSCRKVSKIKYLYIQEGNFTATRKMSIVK